MDRTKQYPRFHSLGRLYFRVRATTGLLLLTIFTPTTATGSPPHKGTGPTTTIPLSHSPRGRSGGDGEPRGSSLISANRLLFTIITVRFSFTRFNGVLKGKDDFFYDQSTIVEVEPSTTTVKTRTGTTLELGRGFSILPVTGKG